MKNMRAIGPVVAVLGLCTLAGCVTDVGSDPQDSSYPPEAHAEEASDLEPGLAARSTEAVVRNATTALHDAKRQGAITRLEALYEQEEDGEGFEEYAVVPELNGLRVMIPGNGAIYLIDHGVRRHIPDPATYERLFRDWNGVEVAYFYALVDEGTPLSSQAALMQGTGQPAVYLVDQGVKRWITSPAAMDRYYFAWEQIRDVPPFLLALLPDGPAI